MTDKHAALALPPSKVLGCDFSGTIIALGQAVSPSSAFSPGDRIAGIIHGCQYSHTGAFAEYLVTDANLCFKVPDSVKLENACTLGVGWVSAMQALHRLYNDDHGPTGKEDTVILPWIVPTPFSPYSGNKHKNISDLRRSM